ncbi:MAG: threonylcarbamoyl-AMP synthase [Glaciimonas sp.]|nr:threonylcarbamoyl-AMP synthase [Glaciimonas sp.]
MSQFFHIHPDNPQLRLIKQAVQIIQGGGIVALPTDCCYALVCQLDNKNAVERMRRIRSVDDKHHLTLLCIDLSEISEYAKVDNRQFRLLKSATPGPYTFILSVSKELPRRLSHPSRKTIGLRIPESIVVQALLEELGQPLIGTTLILPGNGLPLTEAEEIRDKLEKQLELVIESGACSLAPTTVIDFTADEPVLIRQGRGDIRLFGLYFQ